MSLPDVHLDVVVRPDEETRASVLLSGLFEQVHRELAARRLTSVGVSFPEAGEEGGLGTRLRLHGSEVDLRPLGEMSWLVHASDYYRTTPVRAVPAEYTLRVVRRLQPNLSAAKIRRLLARQSVTEERAAELLAGRDALTAPYVQIRSKSSGQRFKLFFEQAPVKEAPTDRRFNAYGFGAAVPWF